MRCTECGRHVAPVVAVDIDGTLGDYHGHFLRFAEGYLGRDLPQEYHGAMEFSDYLGLGKQEYRDIKLAYRQGGMKRTMPIYPWATQMVDSFRRQGIEVFVTTTRPFLRLDNVDPDTRHWLQRHGIPFDGLLYDEEKYARLATIVDPSRVIAVIDDLGSQYDSANEVFGEGIAILRHTYWNRGVRREKSSDDLRIINALVESRCREWEKNHGI